MADWLAVEDLFTLGLGFDIAGAALLAQGLLMSPGDIRQTARTYGWFNAHVANSSIDDKVAGRFGRLALILGFTLQIAGYVTVLGTGTTARSSASRALGALIATLLGVGVVIGAHLVLRDRCRRAESIRVARQTPQGKPQDEPDGSLLAAMAEERWGKTKDPDETFRAFARRTWGVDNATEPNA